MDYSREFMIDGISRVASNVVRIERVLSEPRYQWTDSMNYVDSLIRSSIPADQVKQVVRGYSPTPLKIALDRFALESDLGYNARMLD